MSKPQLRDTADVPQLSSPRAAGAVGVATRVRESSVLGHTSLPEVEPIDRLIFQHPDPYSLDPAEVADTRLLAITEALRSHRERCPAFDRYLEMRRFSVDTFDDLTTIPVIPTTAFKRSEITSVGPQDVVQSFLSSGTNGLQSLVPRDEVTLQRLMGGMRAAFKIVEPLLGNADPETDVTALHLGPPRDEAKSVWFSYVMTLVGTSFPTEHFLTSEGLQVTAAASDLVDLVSEGQQVGVFGSPAFVHMLAEYLLDNRIALQESDSLFVVTGGGWKRAAGSAIPRDEFDQLVMRAFGLVSGSRIRDAFNQVELNSVFMECESGRKHVPPWVHVTVRSVETLEPLPNGESGLMSYIDPSAHSYPGFIVADDIGLRHKTSCECGRLTETVEIVRRVQRSEHLGCALQLERGVESPSQS